jgi:hypothetical protein
MGPALVLYYIHWVSPSSGNAPQMLSGPAPTGASMAGPVEAPSGKLDYTFGAFWVPLIGLLGLVRAEAPSKAHSLRLGPVASRSSAARSGLQLPPETPLLQLPAIAIGFGLALRRLEEKGSFWVAVFLLVVVYLVVTGSSFWLATGARLSAWSLSRPESPGAQDFQFGRFCPQSMVGRVKLL